jgi:hypothetical protein
VEAVATFTGPPDGQASFTVLTSDFEPVLYVRQGQCERMNAEVACFSDDVGSGVLQEQVATTSGERYYLMLDGAFEGNVYTLAYNR